MLRAPKEGRPPLIRLGFKQYSHLLCVCAVTGRRRRCQLLGKENGPASEGKSVFVPGTPTLHEDHGFCVNLMGQTNEKSDNSGPPIDWPNFIHFGGGSVSALDILSSETSSRFGAFIPVETADPARCKCDNCR